MNHSDLALHHTNVSMLWWFTDHHGRSAVCCLIERKDVGILRMELEYDGYRVLNETYRNMEALQRSSREYHDRAVAEGWTERHDSMSG